MIVIVDQHIPFIRGVLEQFADVRYMPGAAMTRSSVAGADALIVRTRTACTPELLEGTKISFIASATIGYDHIDTAYCEKNGIVWTNAPGCNSSSVRQYIAAALGLAGERFGGMKGKTIGVVGVGNVGSKVAAHCRLAGLNVLLNDPPRQRREGTSNFVPLRTVIEEADIISFHVPLTESGEDKTFHLADRAFFSKLRPSQLFINTSRGEVAESGALKEALRNKQIAASILDVWEEEPRIDRDLLSKTFIATPHIAGYSTDGKANGTAMSVQALSRHFGLGIDSWFPAKIPPPEKAEHALDCTGLDAEKVLARAVALTYDIAADDRRMKESPECFEKQRADYPLRREFPAYTLHLKHAGAGVREICEQAGFHTVVE
jgi:erythronate-4-phosphate dehydrogenase